MSDNMDLPCETVSGIEDVIDAYRIGNDPDTFVIAELLADLHMYTSRHDLNWSAVVDKADSFVSKRVTARITGGDDA